jgi:hypothetical protein
MFVALVDEIALRQPIGGDEVMKQQYRSLAEAAERWIIQVVPQMAGMYRRLDGPFVIATVDGTDHVYTPTQRGGYILDSPEAVAEVKWVWEAIRAEALPKQQTRDLILEMADEL